MVIGIVARNGILLLNADQKFRAEGWPAEAIAVVGGIAASMVLSLVVTPAVRFIWAAPTNY